MPPNPPASSGGSGPLAGLNHKIGPQPMWAWMAEILGVALAYALYQQRKQAAAAATSSTAGTSSGTVPADQVPDVIIQNELMGPHTSGPTTATPAGTTSAPPTTTSKPGRHRGGGGSGSSSTTPPSAPSGAAPASSVPVVAHGKVTSVNNNDAVITWSATGTDTFRLTTNGPGFKNHTSVVNGTTGHLSGLQAGHTYTVNVQPLVNGVPVGNSGNIDIVTTK